MSTFIDGNTQKAVEYVFDVMQNVYGDKWERTHTSGIDDAKSLWAYQLNAYTHTANAKKSILWACKNLPNHVPTAIGFCSLCRAAYNLMEESKPVVETEPKPALQKTKNKKVLIRPKAWAYKLKARHEAGEKLHTYQITCYQEALR